MRSISIAALLFLTAGVAGAQHRSATGLSSLNDPGRPGTTELFPPVPIPSPYVGSGPGYPAFPAGPAGALQSDSTASGFPDPKSVMYKSMIVPGWGQVINRQAWKVPIVYGLIGGLAWYAVQLNLKYHDYRAAYYNLNPATPGDMRFGPTPGYIPADASLEALRQNRDTFRNRRDLIYVTVVLAYGLNILDAYVFAHMRSFDVSEDLSMRTRLRPAGSGLGPGSPVPAPGLTLSFELYNRSTHE